ncbi:MAG: ureidoglycolate lyase [Crinalium sp.]
MNETQLLKNLSAQLITPALFQEYGQVIYPNKDGKFYDANDAQLNLKNGIPRLYIMRLYHQGRQFNKITRHVKCTQCLGSLAGKEWLIAVAPPSDSNQPLPEKIVAFRIPGNCFIKLEIGTWHSGPYFDDEFIDFYNLELSDTNVNDHETCNLLSTYNMQLTINN